MLRLSAILFGIVLALAASPLAFASKVSDLTRIRGQGEFKLRGLGLVVGLNGTGDSGKDLVLARPLAKLLESEGNSPGQITELMGAKAVAVVWVDVTIPEVGGRADDKFDAYVSAAYGAQSLRGGRLVLSPLRGPLPNSPIYAFASGSVELSDPSLGASGKVRAGAQLLRDVAGPVVGDSFDLYISPYFSGWASAQKIATCINSDAGPGPLVQGMDSSIRVSANVATVLDDRTIRVVIPEAERPDKAGFVAAVLSASVRVAELDLPAQVIVNQRSGVIIITGDVEISPGLVTHKDLVINTTVPTPIGTPQNPLTTTTHFAELRTRPRASDNARLADLMSAMKQLDVSVTDQIEILQMLYKTGRLHAKMIVD
ncbi:MAG: flagellar basal body P-ring protein FlgI [Phycisphaeraceae bacterium]|nr:flagellar basal body P-ring protein FlgI [Phycisphaeraceae bacterium]